MPAAPSLFEQLNAALASGEAEDAIKGVKGLIVFDIDGTKWALELRPGKEKKVMKGAPEDKPDVTLVIADADFAKLVGGASPQTMFLTRKLKIQGSMAVALKTQSILAAARPKAKL